MKVKAFSVPQQGYNTSTVEGRKQLTSDLTTTLKQDGVADALGLKQAELPRVADDLALRMDSERQARDSGPADFILTPAALQKNLLQALAAVDHSGKARSMEGLKQDYFPADGANDFADTSASRGKLLVLLSVLGADEKTLAVAAKKLNPSYSPVPAEARAFLQSHFETQALAFSLLEPAGSAVATRTLDAVAELLSNELPGNSRLNNSAHHIRFEQVRANNGKIEVNVFLETDASGRGREPEPPPTTKEIEQTREFARTAIAELVEASGFDAVEYQINIETSAGKTESTAFTLAQGSAGSLGQAAEMLDNELPGPFRLGRTSHKIRFEKPHVTDGKISVRVLLESDPAGRGREPTPAPDADELAQTKKQTREIVAELLKQKGFTDVAFAIELEVKTDGE